METLPTDSLIPAPVQALVDRLRKGNRDAKIEAVKDQEVGSLIYWHIQIEQPTSLHHTSLGAVLEPLPGLRIFAVLAFPGNVVSVQVRLDD